MHQAKEICLNARLNARSHALRGNAARTLRVHNRKHRACHSNKDAKRPGLVPTQSVGTSRNSLAVGRSVNGYNQRVFSISNKRSTFSFSSANRCSNCSARCLSCSARCFSCSARCLSCSAR